MASDDNGAKRVNVITSFLDTAPVSDVGGTSEYSPSPSPFTVFNDTEDEYVPNDSNDPQPPTDTLAVNQNEDSPEDSIGAMIQSILNDSDNDVINNNMNILGYNNIPYDHNRHEPIHNASNPSSKSEGIDPITVCLPPSECVQGSPS